MPWVIAVLTTPVETRRALKGRVELARARRRAVAIVREWAVRWMWRGVQVSVGGCVTIHPEGDESPGVWAPHFNVLLPALALDEHGTPRKGRWHVPPEALDDLRRRWGAELERWGFEWDCAPQVHVQHAHEPGKKQHAGRYFGRSFPNWTRQVQSITYFGILAGKLELPSIEPDFADDGSEDFRSTRCRNCGAWYGTIAVQGPNGEWIPVGAGPPE